MRRSSASFPKGDITSPDIRRMGVAAVDRTEDPLLNLSTPDLVRHALEEAKLYAKAEVLHAKRELQDELKAAKIAGAMFGVAAVLALCGLSVLFVSLALALPMSQ